MAANAPISLNLSRIFPAARERVFRAWTEPDQMTRWFGPGDYTAPAAEVDLRVGGAFRIEFRSPEGGTYTVGGVYREIDPPDRLVFTWVWEPSTDHDYAGVETLVTIEFRERGAETEVVLTHERFSDRAMCERHEYGWSTSIEKLTGLL